MNKKTISLSIIIIGVVCAATYFVTSEENKIK
jgi:hypothetical protein